MKQIEVIPRHTHNDPILQKIGFVHLGEFWDIYFTDLQNFQQKLSGTSGWEWNVYYFTIGLQYTPWKINMQPKSTGPLGRGKSWSKPSFSGSIS